MPKCPKCGKEIDYLREFMSEEFKLTVDENGYVHYDLVDASVLNRGDEYKCPECGEVLFTDEEEAVKFLKGKTLEKGE